MVEQNKTDSTGSKPGVYCQKKRKKDDAHVVYFRLTPLCLTALSKIDKIKKRDYFENLAKQLQRLPVKRRFDPNYSKRLCKTVTLFYHGSFSKLYSLAF